MKNVEAYSLLWLGVDLHGIDHGRSAFRRFADRAQKKNSGLLSSIFHERILSTDLHTLSLQSDDFEVVFLRLYLLLSALRMTTLKIRVDAPSFVPKPRRAFLFVDNNNLYHGAKHAPNGFDENIRVSIRPLIEVLETSVGAIVVKVVAGSKTTAKAVFDIWASQGYHVMLGASDGSKKESFVDEALHSSG